MPAKGPARSEWLVLLGVLLMVASLAGPGWWAWWRRERHRMARDDLRVLAEAIQRYHVEYGVWPVAGAGPSLDLRYGRMRSNAEVLRALRAEEGPGNVRHEANEQRITFIAVEPYRRGWSGLDEQGAFLDPWGSPYEMAFDSNYDGTCEVRDSVYGRLIGQGMALWSRGPDRRSDTPDDLLHWKPE